MCPQDLFVCKVYIMLSMSPPVHVSLFCGSIFRTFYWSYMPTPILFTFTLTACRLRPFACLLQTRMFILSVTRRAAIWNTEFRSDTSTTATFSLVTALHVSCVLSGGIATSLRVSRSGVRISGVASRPALGPNPRELCAFGRNSD
jgi:hypothetical protein